MSALITEFDTRGNEKRRIPTSFRFFGVNNDLYLEIQIGTNKTVEVNVNAIKSAELKHRMGKR